MVRLAAAAVVACAAVLALAEYPRAIGKLSDRAVPAAPTDRLLADALAVDISRRYLLAARELVRPGDTFLAETGPNVNVSTPVTLDAFVPYVRFLLLPRRQADDAGSANWLLCYGCDLAPWKGRLDVRWNAEPGLVIARIRR